MRGNRPSLFRRQHFEDQIIVLCVRWYLRYRLSYRDVQELILERGLTVDHTTLGRWVQRYAPVGNNRQWLNRLHLKGLPPLSDAARRLSAEISR